MALKGYMRTLSGSTDVVPDRIRKGIRQMILQNPSGNGVVYVGSREVDNTNYAHVIADGGTLVIGPFSGDAPTNTLEWGLYGTDGKVVNVLLITH